MKAAAILLSATLCATALAPAAALAAATTTAQDSAAVQQQIDAHNAQIKQLDSEIAQYQKQLDAVSSKKQTLQTTLDQIDLSIKKVQVSINVAQNRISATELEIGQLAKGIDSKQASIEVDKAGLSQALRGLALSDNQPLFMQLLGSANLGQIWSDVETLQSLQSAVNDRITLLASEKKSLADTKTQEEQKRVELIQQQSNLAAQRGSLNATKSAQAELLAETKNQEANYQAIISAKQAQEAQVEQALNNLKAQYQIPVTASQIPPAAPGILQWPIYGTIRITQFFGDTPFSNSHQNVYRGHGHDGIDIGVPIGTPVHAALAGTVLATGNTDADYTKYGRCYSFGKWIMLKHANGLNTMYAHLSERDVKPGDVVATGQVIGYSGMTGYATGPHLHFGVYVGSVTKIVALGVATNAPDTPCATAIMPVPPVSGYLNPLSYLATKNYINDSQ